MKVKVRITKRVGSPEDPSYSVGMELLGWLQSGGDFETTGSDLIHPDFFEVVQQFPDEPKTSGVIYLDNEPENANWIRNACEKMVVDNQPHSQAYMKHQGIGQALNLFAEDESLQSAIDKAETWRNDLEEMRELGSSEEVKAINVLYDVLQTWLGQAIEISTARRVKTRKVKRGTS